MTVAIAEGFLQKKPQIPTRGEWFVLHTKSRQEKILSDELWALRIGAYLPLVREVRFYSGRRAVVEVPLFPGYVFLRGDQHQAQLADRTKRIAQIITVHDQGRLDWELRNIATALGTGRALVPYPALQRGVKAEVMSGPMRGLQGVVQSRKSERLILQIDMLGQAVSVELDGATLDPIE
jgi:transcriptional antiterminator RfaH